MTSTVLTKRPATSSYNNGNDEREKAKFYLNIYFKRKQIGYIVMDSHPQLVEKLQAHDEVATRLIQMCTASFREVGEDTRWSDLSELDIEINEVA
ncbi:hypothetical protein [Moraxella marmotae]|uniref:hypothetical protein n=1 Tax=Moraxella marmotae TaxID=3344520 RepID=UPI0035D4B0EA